MVFLTTIPISLNFFKGQISELQKHFDITLISSEEKMLKFIAEREGTKWKKVVMKRDISIFFDIVSFFNLLFTLTAINPKIIHCNTPKASFLGLIAGYITRVPVRVYYVHGLRYEGALGLKRIVLELIEQISCFCATHILAVSYGVKEEVRKKLTSKPVIVIHNGSPNGINITEFQSYNIDKDRLKAEIGINEADFVYGFVGRLVGDKGIDDLIEVFRNICSLQTNVKLLLVGPFEDKLNPVHQKTKSEIENNPNILHVGFQSEVKKFLSILDVFVSPSRREGFGLSLLEANCMGVPVIASRIKGYSEIVKDGINGYLIPVGNKEELSSSMLYVLQNRERLGKMRRDCIRLAEEKYNQSDVISEAVYFYRKIADV